jgi:lipid-A-disaccharide synthase
MTTIFIVATETSGDIHGGNLARQLKAIDPERSGWSAPGGSHMREAGVEILIDPHRPRDRSASSRPSAHQPLREDLPPAPERAAHLAAGTPLRLIDSPTSTCRFASRVKDHGIPVIYYISPQIWPGARAASRRSARSSAR